MSVKFFCENCKFEVPLNVDACPYCGKNFYSVFCPRCRKEGTSREFRNGCPACGYLKEHYRSSRKKKIPYAQANGKPVKLPRWIYSLTIIILALGIITMLVMIAMGVQLP